MPSVLENVAIVLQLHHWERNVQEHQLFSRFANKSQCISVFYLRLGCLDSLSMCAYFPEFLLLCFSTLSAFCLSFCYFCCLSDVRRLQSYHSACWIAYEWPVIPHSCFCSQNSRRSSDRTGWDPNMDRSWSLPSWLRCRKSWSTGPLQSMTSNGSGSKFSPKRDWLVSYKRSQEY